MLYRDGIYYYVRRVPYDLTSYYDIKRLCFSLKTKSVSAAVRASKSINQRLEDYWLGLRLQNIYIPAIQDIKKVQSLCKDIDDEMRWLIALISNTGMRLGEAAGLLKEDIKLDEPIPHIDLKPHPWRSLKTRVSQKLIPLTKEALWTSKRILETNNDSIFTFPRYCDETGCKAN